MRPAGALSRRINQEVSSSTCVMCCIMRIDQASFHVPWAGIFYFMVDLFLSSTITGSSGAIDLVMLYDFDHKQTHRQKKLGDRF